MERNHQRLWKKVEQKNLKKVIRSKRYKKKNKLKV